MISTLPIGRISGVIGQTTTKIVIRSFDELVGGLVANETKAGLKFTVDKVGIKSVYKDLRQNGYELISVSRSQGQGLRVLLNPDKRHEHGGLLSISYV